MVIAALLVVGSVSPGVLRHIMQTAIVGGGDLGIRRCDLSKRVALPSFVLWRAIIVFIRLFLLERAQIVHSTICADGR
jgi:hypothetical protein